MPTFAIIYGFGEGPLLSKKLRRTFERHDWEHTDDVSNADVIITHSGGSLLIPAQFAAKAILIIAPTAGYRGAIVANVLRKVALDYKLAWRQRDVHSCVGRYCVNIGYSIAKPRHVAAMWREAHNQPERKLQLPAVRTGTIVFRDDPWGKHLHESVLQQSQHTFMSYDRPHDDLWKNPQDYLPVIQYLYES
jgi:hypothetical protein